MHSSGSRLRLSLLFVSLLAPILALAVFIGSMALLPLGSPGNPLGSGAFYVNPNSTAVLEAATESQAGSDTDARTSAIVSKIAAQPAAIWLLPEKYPLKSVEGSVADITDDAEAHGKLPVFVVYGIPNRDCGNHSGGGLSTAEYPKWVNAIAEALATREAAVILEPDSLTLAAQCNATTERIGQISAAVDAFSASEATVYLDGGHSDWLTPQAQAELLRQAGVERVRGFATNVSNYNDSASEHKYAEELSSLTHGSHYVVDTSRNGRGSNGEWCNPAGRALGATPGLVTSGSQDANLWIKQPGESDGVCNGGPAAGKWWPERALELGQNAGW